MSLDSHVDGLNGSSRVPGPLTSGEMSGKIPFPLFANISDNSHGDYPTTNWLC